MAGAGAKLFVSGDVLTAAQVNTYLMDQTVMVFATTAARDAAFGGAGEPTLSEGMCCYILNLNEFQVYDGSAWKQMLTGASVFSDDVQINTTGLALSGVDATVDGGQYGLISRVNSTDANGSFLGFFKARGTAAAQTIVANGDDIGLVRFFAYDGATMREAARIKADVNGAPGSGDMPGALSFHTTPDGSTTLTERMRINNAGLITGSGTSLGTWTSFTPTWTNLTIGNGTQGWEYCQLGKLVFVRGRMTWGSTTSATGGATVMSIPVTMRTAAFHGLGSAVFVDSGTQTYWGEVYPNSTTSVGFNTQLVSASGYAVSSATTSTTPFTWTTNDNIGGFFMYEAE